MRGIRAAGVCLVVLVLPVCGCGGGNGESAEVEDGVESFLEEEGSELRVGLNANGAIVAVNETLVSHFSGGEKTIENVEVSDVKVQDDKDQATAKATFELSSSSGTVTCESAVLAMRREGEWQPALITVGSCS